MTGATPYEPTRHDQARNTSNYGHCVASHGATRHRIPRYPRSGSVGVRGSSPLSSTHGGQQFRSFGSIEVPDTGALTLSRPRYGASLRDIRPHDTSLVAGLCRV